MKNNIKARCRELGINQRDLAAELAKSDPRIDVPMVSKFATGICLPTEDVLEAMENALQATREELYPDGGFFFAAAQDDEIEAKDASHAVLDLIPYGRENAIQRRRLAELLDMTDGGIRAAIRRARKAGVIIINDQDGAGYYRSDDLDDIERQYWQDTSRAMAILVRRKFLRRRLKAAGRTV